VSKTVWDKRGKKNIGGGSCTSHRLSTRFVCVVKTVLIHELMKTEGTMEGIEGAIGSRR
jgi:hypothetical protein